MLFLPAPCFQRAGRPPRDNCEPDWAHIAAETKRKGVTLTLLWQEYRSAHPEGYGYTWFCGQFHRFQKRTSASFRNRHEAGAVMQTDYAGHTIPIPIPITDPGTGEVHTAQILVAVPGASSYTFAWASLGQPDPEVAGLDRGPVPDAGLFRRCAQSDRLPLSLIAAQSTAGQCMKISS